MIVETLSILLCHRWRLPLLESTIYYSIKDSEYKINKYIVFNAVFFVFVRACVLAYLFVVCLCLCVCVREDFHCLSLKSRNGSFNGQKIE